MASRGNDGIELDNWRVAERVGVAVEGGLLSLPSLEAVAARFRVIPFRRRRDALRLAGEAAVAALLADASAFRAPGLPALLRRCGSPPPVLYLGTRVDDARAAQLLGRAAADVVRLPCGPLELLARIDAALSRSRRAKPGSVVVVDLAALRIRAGETSITLRRDEAAVLACLAAAHPSCMSGKDLRHRALGSCGGSGPVRTHLWALHARLRQFGASAVVVEAVRGAGYRFAETVQIVRPHGERSR